MSCSPLATGNRGIVEFQRSVENTKESLFFTVNLGVVCGELLDSRPSVVSKAAMLDAHLRQRIGALLAILSISGGRLPDRPTSLNSKARSQV